MVVDGAEIRFRSEAKSTGAGHVCCIGSESRQREGVLSRHTSPARGKFIYFNIRIHKSPPVKSG